jgi:hypothetical protein
VTPTATGVDETGGRYRTTRAVTIPNIHARVFGVGEDVAVPGPGADLVSVDQHAETLTRGHHHSVGHPVQEIPPQGRLHPGPLLKAPARPFVTCLAESLWEWYMPTTGPLATNV